MMAAAASAERSPSSSLADTEPGIVLPCKLGADEGTVHQSFVIDHAGSGRLIHKVDGTMVWESTQDGPLPAPGGARAGGVPREANFVGDFIKAAAVALPVYGGAMGMIACWEELGYAHQAGVCLTTRQLTSVVANTVASCVAGTIVGTVLGPLRAVRMLAGPLVRPAVVGILAHGAISLIKRHTTGVAGIIRRLKSCITTQQMEALKQLILQAARNTKFAQELNKFAGVELLLKMLSDATADSPLLHLLVQALAELAKDNDCKDSMVNAGGVPMLVPLLRCPNPLVAQNALSALKQLADHPAAQDAIRESGGLQDIVGLLSQWACAQQLIKASCGSASPTAAAGASAFFATPHPFSSAFASPNASYYGLAPAGAAGDAAEAAMAPAASVGVAAMPVAAVTLLQTLALDPANKAAIGAVGGVAALLQLIAAAPTNSEVQQEAVVALHNVLRGNPSNQRALAALPNASATLRRVLCSGGSRWTYPARGDLRDLLALLARMRQQQQAAEQTAAAAAALATAPSATLATSTMSYAAQATDMLAALQALPLSAPLSSPLHPQQRSPGALQDGGFVVVSPRAGSPHAMGA